jgi:beta-phosphoglucomutase-like phosphatase (HAD superfamily)
MAIRGLLFDFDGLLVDTETAVLTAWQEVYRDHGHELPLDLWAKTVGTHGAFDVHGHLEQLVGSALDRAAIDGPRIERELGLCDVEQLRPGVVGYLEEARRRELATAIVSSSSRDWIDRHLARLERAADFGTIVTADRDRERAKPAPTLYLEALDLLGLAPGEAVALEDSVNGLRAAKAAGIYCVAVPNGVTAGYDFAEADLVVDSLAELPLDDLLARAARLG